VKRLSVLKLQEIKKKVVGGRVAEIAGELLMDRGKGGSGFFMYGCFPMHVQLESG